MKKFILLLAGMLSAYGVKASEPAMPDSIVRPVTSHFTYSIGSALIANTYLTPLKYHGWGMLLGYDRTQAMRLRPEKLVQRIAAGLDIDRTENPAGNASMWRLTGDFSYGVNYRWRLPYEITVAGGVSTGIDLGVVYNNRNGNNPVAVEAAWTVNVTGAVMWRHTLVGKKVLFTYRPTIPLTGVFFSPDYGELFYEISLGNHSGLAHCAWWGNYFRMENLLTADIALGGTQLRLGFRNSILSTRVNNITTRVVTCAAVIGVGGTWMSVNPYKGISPDARIISATY
ncbi:DUF3316 domain-containing protein [uncultured Muribaculum sp.]|nr:DUF3316 domain-containing protein [uncultured Muribaculum sp.]